MVATSVLFSSRFGLVWRMMHSFCFVISLSHTHLLFMTNGESQTYCNLSSRLPPDLSVLFYLIAECLCISIAHISVYTHATAKRKRHHEMAKWPIRSNIKIGDWRWKGELTIIISFSSDAIFMYWVLFISIDQSIDFLPICSCQFIRTPNLLVSARTRARISNVWMLSDYDAKVMLNLTIAPFIYIALFFFSLFF